MMRKITLKNWAKVKGYNGLFSPDGTLGYTKEDILSKNKNAIYIGSFSVELLKKLLKMLDNNQTLKIFVDKKKLQLMPCTCNDYYLAPRDVPEIIRLVK